jgi:hypothetical protein
VCVMDWVTRICQDQAGAHGLLVCRVCASPLRCASCQHLTSDTSDCLLLSRAPSLHPSTTHALSRMH